MPRSRRYYVYVKPGNACAEALRAGPGAPVIPDGGPDLYTASFLRFARDTPSAILALTDQECVRRVGRTEVRCLRFRSADGRASGRLALLRTLLRFLVLLLRRRPSHVFCFLIGPPQWTARLGALLCGARYVQSLHNIVAPQDASPRTRMLRGLDRLVIRSAHRVICHEAYLEQTLRDMGVPSDRIIRYEAGYRHFLESALRSETRFDCIAPEDVVLLFASRLTHGKGAFDLLEAARTLCPRFPRLKVLFAGKDTAGDELSRAIRAAGLEDRVRYLGFLDRPTLSGLVRASHVVVTPTRSHFPEGRCMIMAEALVLGKPVVAPNFGPFPFYLEHGKDGLLFAPDSVADLTTQLERLLADPSLLETLSRGARAKGEALLDPKRTYLQALRLAADEPDPLPEEVRP